MFWTIPNPCNNTVCVKSSAIYIREKKVQSYTEPSGNYHLTIPIAIYLQETWNNNSLFHKWFHSWCSMEFLSYFPMILTTVPIATTNIRLAVVVSLILNLQISDSQGGWVGGAVSGAREPIRNPRWSFIVVIDHIGGWTSNVLLVPVHIVASNVTTAALAGDGDCAAKRPRHRVWLS